MKRAFAGLLAWGVLFSPAWSQESVPEIVPPIPDEPEHVILEDDGARVSVLGYHIFHPTYPASEMRIPTEKFRKQMEMVKATNIPVITMAQFLAWRRGEAEIPPRSYLITMDDGWKSVYTEAFPIMKEMQFPYTIFLYKNYVGSHRGGRALSLEMIEEMVKSDLCTIGSHSVSHPFPRDIKKHAKKGPQAYDDYNRNQMGESKSFLDETFGINLTSYAYPGGYYTKEMYPIADEVGYDTLFTVKPGKVRRDSSRYTLPRYIVLGNNDGAFEAALTFRNGNMASTILAVDLPFPARPGVGENVAKRLPTIRVDFSNADDVDPDSLVMQVAGFGEVPAELDPETGLFSWTVSRPLRQAVCDVSVRWKLKSKAKGDYETPMKWTFRIDREASYQAE